MSPLSLNLAGADTKGFDAIPAGTYDAAVQEMKMIEIKGEEGALPKGTPGFNVQFRINGGDFDNRRVFTNYWIAPEKVSGKKYENKSKMDGMLVRFFTALGFDEAEVTGGSFEPDLEDLIGTECRVVVGQKPKYGGAEGELDNEVRGVKAAGESVGAGLI
jgi:hypothetical protein